MKLTSPAFHNGNTIPHRYAMGMAGEQGHQSPVCSENVSPPLEWSDVPEGTASFVVVCVDPDAPSFADGVNQVGQVVEYHRPRANFVHWLVANIPAERRALAEGEDSQTVTPRGKSPGQRPYGVVGVNSYTQWFAEDEAMHGVYGGYDGPWPPFNDERIHRYVFTVFALDVPTLNLSNAYDYDELMQKMQGHVLGSAQLFGTYAINPEAQ